MRITKTSFTILACVAGAVLFCAPTAMIGYSLLGGSLPQSSGNYQRDVRVFDNWQDSAANGNQTPNASFPGALGADLAVWKAAVAWNSDTGGARNFDFDWQGDAGTIGGTNGNTVSSLEASCGGGTLAFTESPGSNGWRIRFCEEWVWDDGPSTPGGRIDIQGVCAHELGHALGLGHSGGSFCSGACGGHSVMCPAVCDNGTAERNIKTDDRNGLNAIYGMISGSKPFITGVSGGQNSGETLTIDGMNFAGTVNVKFTAGTSVNGGTIPGVVYGLSSTNGGTRVEAVIPATARSGNVFVWQPGSGGLSNYFPVAINEVPPMIAGIDPAMGQVRGNTLVTLSGSGFQTGLSLTFGDQVLETVVPQSITGNEIVFRTPQGASVGTVASVSVSQVTGNSTLPNAFTYTENDRAIEFNAGGGQPSVGGNLNIEAYSLANKPIALAVALPGTTMRQGLTFCVELPTIGLWKFGAGLNSGPQGQVSVVLQNLPGPSFNSYNITGVERTSPGVLTILDCSTFTVFP